MKIAETALRYFQQLLIFRLVTRSAGRAGRFAGVGQFILVRFHAGSAVRACLVGAEFLRILAASPHTSTTRRRCPGILRKSSTHCRGQQCSRHQHRLDCHCAFPSCLLPYATSLGVPLPVSHYFGVSFGGILLNCTMQTNGSITISRNSVR
jgi:hypothetical protein